MPKLIRTETDAAGREILVYDDGFMQDKETGRIVAPSREHSITSERGRELVARRWELVRGAFTQGIYQGLFGNKPLPAMDELTAEQAREVGRIYGEAMRNPKVVNRLPEFLRAWAEVGNLAPSATERRRENSENPYGPAVELVVNLTEVIKILKDATQPQPETVEGEAKTIEE